MISQDPNIRKTIIHLLYQQATQDNFLHPFELHYIQKLIQDFDLPIEATLQEVQQDPLPFEFTLPKTEQERMEILYHLLFMAKFDKNIHQAEIDFLRQLSLKLCIREDLIEDLITIMQQNLNTTIPPDALLNVIKKYLN